MLQNVIKYIAVTKHRVLCAGGWKLKSNVENCQIKLFKAPCMIEQYFQNTANYIRPKYEIKKVRVRIEVLDDDSEYSD